MSKFLVAFSILCLFSFTANAAAGCINAARNRIYTSQHPSGYWRTNSSSTSTAGCLYVYTGGICSIGSVGANNGYLGDTVNAQECPIDDYAGVMVVLFGALSYFIIRRTNTRLVSV